MSGETVPLAAAHSGAMSYVRRGAGRPFAVAAGFRARGFAGAGFAGACFFGSARCGRAAAGTGSRAGTGGADPESGAPGRVPNGSAGDVGCA